MHLDVELPRFNILEATTVGVRLHHWVLIIELLFHLVDLGLASSQPVQTGFDILIVIYR
jgi:hypothetical protein